MSLEALQKEISAVARKVSAKAESTSPRPQENESLPPTRTKYSTLRAKTLLVVLVVTVGLLLALVIPLYTIILNSFVQLEQVTVRTDLSRGSSALDARLSAMHDAGLNWSSSDNTYNFAASHDPQVLDSDLPDSALAALHLNVFALYDSSGKLLYSRAYDYEKGQRLNLPPFFACETTSCGVLVRQQDKDGGLQGLLQLPDGLAMVVALPVVTGQQQGPPRGTLVLARFLDQTEVDRLSRTTSLSLKLQSLQDYNLSRQGSSTAPLSDQTASAAVQVMSEDAVLGSVQLRDIYGNPVAVLTVTDPRNIYNEGKVSVQLFTMALIVGSVVFGALALILIQFIIVSRLSKLSASLAEIGSNGDASARVTVSGNDELSHLGDSINATLAALESSYEERRDTEANYHAIIEQTSEAIFMINAKSGRFIEANPAFHELLGYADADLRGLHVSDIVVLDPATLAGILSRAQSNRRLLLNEVEYRHKDGSFVHVALNASYIRRNTGDVLCFVAHDLTERKRAEEERALHLSEERFRSLVQNAADIISIINSDGVIRYQSPSVESILGYEATEMVGTNIFSYVHPDDEEEIRTALTSLFERPEISQRALIRARHLDGSWRHLEAIGANLLDDPNVGGVLLNIRDVTERKALEERLTHQAFHDPLTGLPNRVFFHNKLQIAVDSARHRDANIAVVFLDLDNFKVVNDSLGHQAGDKLLIDVAHRLRNSLRSTDTVARFGGDEFTFLLENDVNEQTVVSAVERIQQALATPVSVGGHDLIAASSIGIVISNPDTLYPEELLRRADVALYRAKRSGKAQSAIYANDMKADAIDRLLLEIDLRHAIERNELMLYYQPLVELTTGRVTGVESLLRWRHPVRGIIAPSEFIPLAEENGMIIQIGQWALERACYQAKVWQSDPAINPTLTVSVNLSARQFRQPDLVQSVAQVLEITGLNPRSLKLEITETVGMEDAEQTLIMLHELKKLDVSLALDDFGMGHSALSYLKRFPIDTLKLDRLFISGLGTDREDTAIVQAAVNLARAMGLDVTAEGVETREQISTLYSLGCDHGQGYFFARPMPAFAMETYLKVKRVQLQDVSTRDLQSGALKSGSLKSGPFHTGELQEAAAEM